MMQALLQALANGVLETGPLALPALGFTIIFAVLRFPDFAIAAYATIGGFAGWTVNAYLGWSAVPVLLTAFVVAGVVGAVSERLALARLLPAGALTAAIGSIALNLVLESAVRFGFGNGLRGYDLPLVPDVPFGPVRVGVQQIEDLLLAVGVLVVVFCFLRFSRFGRAMRAAADNADLARLKGISPERVAFLALFLGAGLAGAGGVLIGFDGSIDPLTGDRVLLPVFAAAVLGGLGSLPGAVLGALLLSLAEQLAQLVLPASYGGAVGFVAILAMLTFRPRGLLGERTA